MHPVSGDDYVGVVDEILMFAEGMDRVCHNVTILQDNECEILRVEDFFSDLSYVSGDPPITIAPDAARVIIDDSNEPECGELVYIHNIIMCVVTNTRVFFHSCYYCDGE